MSRLFHDPGDDIPSRVDFTLEAFYKHRDAWLLYRSLGHETESGAWVSPLKFSEALTMSKEMIDVFQGLDYVFAQMKKQRAKKKNKKTGAK